MDIPTKYALIRGLFEIAWADGEIQLEEKNVLQTLIASLDLGEENAAEVKSWFSEAPTGDDTWDKLAQDATTAETAAQQVLSIAAADGTLKWDELELLEKVRERLGVEKARFDEIALEVERAFAAGNG